MIIKCLSKLFSDEVQYSGNRQDCVSPDVNVNKENTIIVPDKFKEDIEALENYIGRKNLKADSALRLTCPSFLL